MDNLSIDNALLRPRLIDGWRLDMTRKSPSINNREENRRFDINEISALILRSCDGEQSVESIIQSLQQQFPEAKSEIPGDVESVLLELQQKQVLIFTPVQSDQNFEIPQKTPEHEKRKLCVGMATYDDYDGVYFSVQALRLYHPEILDQIEIIVIDNHPDGPCALSLKQLQNWIPAYRYIPCEHIRGTAVRDYIFREANADYVLCIDSHVMIENGAIEQLLAYFEQNPQCQDLLQGPLLNDDLKNISTHFEPGWNQGMFGTWGMDSRAQQKDAPAFDIPMQGLGLFACAKSAWPGFNPRFSGFGGEEGYIHEKVRQAGGRTLCLPFLRWLHRFNRPMGTRYKVSWDDRIRNYLIGREELGLDDQDVIEHFVEHIGEENTQRIVDSVTAEMAQPYYYFDGIYCLVDEVDTANWQRMQISANESGELRRVIPMPVLESIEDPRVARVCAIRNIVCQSQQGNYQSILIFDQNDGAELSANELQAARLKELHQHSWQLFYPGEILENGVDMADNIPQGGSPIAIHQCAYAQLLKDIPEHEHDVKAWLDLQAGFTEYLARQFTSEIVREVESHQ